MADILLAEDDSSMRTFLTKALQKAGHTVTASPDGLEAYNQIQKKQDYDLLLTDIVMPGMDGIELSKRARARVPKIKVMFITGFTGVALSEHNALSRACNITPPAEEPDPKDKVLSKPFHLNDLIDNIETLLAA